MLHIQTIFLFCFSYCVKRVRIRNGSTREWHRIALFSCLFHVLAKLGLCRKHSPTAIRHSLQTIHLQLSKFQP